MSKKLDLLITMVDDIAMRLHRIERMLDADIDNSDIMETLEKDFKIERMLDADIDNSDIMETLEKDFKNIFEKPVLKVVEKTDDNVVTFPNNEE
jgi:hypothetical protein